MTLEYAATEFEAIRQLYTSNKTNDAVDRSTRLREAFNYDLDPLLGVRIDIWHAIYLSACGRTTVALTVLHSPFEKANNALKETFFNDRDCCFELVFAYYIYCHVALNSGQVHASALAQLLDEAERICVSSNAPGWMTAIHGGRARLYVKLNQPDDALNEVACALELVDRDDTMVEKFGMLRTLARVYSDLERYDLAEDLLIQGEGATRPIDRMYFLTQLGRIKIERDAWQEAAALADRACAYEDQVTMREACAIWAIQASAYRLIDETDRATVATEKLRLAANVLAEPELDYCALCHEIDIHIVRAEMSEAIEKFDAAQIVADRLDDATMIRSKNEELDKRRERYRKRRETLSVTALRDAPKLV